MSRSRDLANLANNATGLETLTVSDITDLTATATELNYTDGVGSAIQTQINSKIGGSNPTITLGSNATFPAGHQVFIKSQNRDGAGFVYRPTAYYPTTTSDLATKSFYLTLTSSEHSSFSKILINFNANFRVNENVHAIADYRLVRWTGTGNVSSETQLVKGTIGDVTSTAETYDVVSGSIIDDISSVGSVQINYTLQYRNHSNDGDFADKIYFGQSGDEHQISAFGIV